MQAAVAVRSQAICRLLGTGNSKRSQNTLLPGQFIQGTPHFAAHGGCIIETIHNHAKREDLLAGDHAEVRQKREDHAGCLRILFDHIVPEGLYCGHILLNGKAGGIHVIRCFGPDGGRLRVGFCRFCARLIRDIMRSCAGQFLLRCGCGGFRIILHTFIFVCRDGNLRQLRIFFRMVGLLIQIIQVTHQA